MGIKVSQLHKTYEGKVPTVVLKGLDFEIKDGSFVALMGKSGSGKSTLLHSLGLLDTPSKGKIYIDDIAVSTLDSNGKNDFRLDKLGYVFQEYAIIPELTAIENVYLPLMVSKDFAKKDYKYLAKDMLEKVGLGHRLDHYPNEMSGGEQQRVAIARALANNPKILYADEPTANLDSESSEEIMQLFSDINKKYNQTILLVSHEPEDIKWVDEVIWLKDGVIEKIDKVKKKK